MLASTNCYFDTAKLYTIKNFALDHGCLSYTYEGSRSGCYLQHLYDGAYKYQSKYYEPDNKWRNTVLWEIMPVPDEEGPYFTIRNKALDYGYVAVSDCKSASGFYVEHLFSNSYDKEKIFYEQGNKFRDKILWYIVEEGQGLYKIINKAFNGMLTYTRREAKSGPYLQVLYGKHYEKTKGNYSKGEKWGKSVYWEIKEAFKNKK